MTIPEEGFLLRVFIGESDRHGHHPLYEAIEDFLPQLDGMITDGLVTWEPIKVLQYKG